MELLSELEKCKRCVDLGFADSNRLRTGQKPYVKFEVERKWRPNRVSVLFIAESPPKNGEQRYFYNPTTNDRNSLRKEILKYLDLESLEEFRNKGYFLIDAIKCRLNKSRQLKSPLRLGKIAKTCTNQFLLREIENLKPKTLFVLGNTAKKALDSFHKFHELSKHRVTEEFDQKMDSCRVVLCVFPGGQTRVYTDKIKRAFEKIR